MGCGGSKNETTVSNTEGVKAQTKKEDPPSKQEPPKVSEEPKQEELKGNDEPDSSPAKEERAASEGFSEFELAALKKHNEYRALHGCPPLTMSRDLCSVAQKWSDHLAATQGFEHSTTKYGENLYMSASSAPDVSGDVATESWYNEIKDYDWNNGGFSLGTGHFTQVVWKETTELGIAAATYEEEGWHKIVVTANYSPAGNMQGAFDANVPPLS